MDKNEQSTVKLGNVNFQGTGMTRAESEPGPSDHEADTLTVRQQATYKCVSWTDLHRQVYMLLL